jgi:hypothetical protein
MMFEHSAAQGARQKRFAAFCERRHPRAFPGGLGAPAAARVARAHPREMLSPESLHLQQL